jgi:hypothetical protein
MMTPATATAHETSVDGCDIVASAAHSQVLAECHDTAVHDPRKLDGRQAERGGDLVARAGARHDSYSESNPVHRRLSPGELPRAGRVHDSFIRT